MRKSANRLTGEQAYKVASWVAENHESFNNLPQQDVADRCHKEVGVFVSVGHIANAKKATGVEWKAKRRGGSTKHKTASNTIVMARAVLALYEAGGMIPPEDLFTLAGLTLPQNQG